MKLHNFTVTKGSLLISLLLTFACQPTSADRAPSLDLAKTEAILTEISEDYKVLFDLPQDTTRIPRSMEADGSLHATISEKWTSGFFPGIWWMVYEFNQDEAYAEKAKAWTAMIEKEKYNWHTHDMGFKIFCSFGQGYRLKQIPAYKDIIIHASETLITRFDSTIGCIRSWGDKPMDRNGWYFPVIIDNMMNLEMLLEATRLTGDSSFHAVVLSHSDKTLQNHFRPDYSSYHVIDYDSLGHVRNRHTHQGIAHESAWARGQSWGLYGYTLVYRYTGDEKYLAQASHIADYIISRLPADYIPYWDYDAPNIPNESRDASAAALTASALLELQGYVSEEKQKRYREIAQAILAELSANYRLRATVEMPFILAHSTGHRPKDSEVDVPIIYADYYYVEALMRLRTLLK